MAREAHRAAKWRRHASMLTVGGGEPRQDQQGQHRRPAPRPSPHGRRQRRCQCRKEPATAISECTAGPLVSLRSRRLRPVCIFFVRTLANGSVSWRRTGAI